MFCKQHHLGHLIELKYVKTNQRKEGFVVTVYSIEFAQSYLFSPYGELRLICPVFNSPTHKFSYIILYKWLN